MSRITNEEAKKRHLSELNKARVKRYKESHPVKQFKADISVDKYNEIDAALKERGITKKQFLENAIDQFLKEGK